MTPERDGTSLLTIRLWAVLSASALALFWAGDARAGCGDLARAVSDAGTAVSSLSAEIVGGETPSPPMPSGCTGPSCKNGDRSANVDFSGRVDLRADSWACILLLIAPDPDGGARLIARSDAARPKTGRDDLIDPPR